MLPEAEVRALMRAEHGDPFAVLGPHRTDEGLWVRALLPGARSVAVLLALAGSSWAEAGPAEARAKSPAPESTNSPSSEPVP